MTSTFLGWRHLAAARALLSAFLSSASEAHDLRLATTTSTDPPGLLRAILPQFERERDGRDVLHALRLLLSADPALWGIVGVSLSVTLRAMLIAMPLGVGVGYCLATVRFPGWRRLIVVTQGLLASPTVVAGLILYLLLSRQGIFGQRHLRFTQTAMVIGQVLIALPVLIAFALSAIQGADPRARGGRRAWRIGTAHRVDAARRGPLCPDGRRLQRLRPCRLGNRLLADGGRQHRRRHAQHPDGDRTPNEQEGACAGNRHPHRPAACLVGRQFGLRLLPGRIAAMSLLDELTANLDSESRAQTIDLLRGFCAEQTTAVIACHDRDVIELPDMQRLHLVDHTLRQALPPTS
jgi:hypothetical protein